jgi:3-methyladenine DNA glycosylase/8-oxoguanine DNA glycosylase
MITIRVKNPFDLRLSLAGVTSFFPVKFPPAKLTIVANLKGRATVVTVWQEPHRSATVQASAMPRIDDASLGVITKWLVRADLDLKPFYKLVNAQARLADAVSSLTGLKPLRPATLFEMAVVAITEQQLSLAAAFHIRKRLIEQFGLQIGDLWRFPEPESLAQASINDLGRCGLSRRKAEYVKELAEGVTQGSLNFERLKEQSDEGIRKKLTAIRGFGEWSIQYMQARGFGRSDALPSGDSGLQRVLGYYFAHGRKLTANQLESALAPYKPFRALTAYYLAVHWRLRRSQQSDISGPIKT